MKRKRWRDLPAGHKAVAGVLAIVQLVLLVAALIDIKRRPQVLIRGRKLWWTLASFINIVGPTSYFLAGRKNPGEEIGRI